MPWQPPPDVLAAGNAARVPYARAVLTGPGVQLAPWAALVALRGAVVRNFPGITSGGLVRDAARIGTASRDPHKAGIGVDFMVAPGPARKRNGDALANFLVRYAEPLQLQYVLWDGLEWSTSPLGPRWERYAGGETHDDHVHAEVGPGARAWAAREMHHRVDAALYADARAGVAGAARAALGFGRRG